jgi:hypothetical protein
MSRKDKRFTKKHLARYRARQEAERAEAAALEKSLHAPRLSRRQAEEERAMERMLGGVTWPTA